jgi:hypothetical protein
VNINCRRMDEAIAGQDRSDRGFKRTATLSEEFVATAQQAAGYYARRIARALGLPKTDIDDIRQDLILEVLIRSKRFDPRRAAWITFVDLVIRHEASDLADRLMSPRTVRFRSLEYLRTHGSSHKPNGTEFLAETGGTLSLWSVPSYPFESVELAVDVDRFMAGLPATLHHLCRLLMTKTSTDAQRHSGLSVAQFYRHLQDLRMRLRSVGLSDGRRPREKDRNFRGYITNRAQQ